MKHEPSSEIPAAEPFKLQASGSKRFDTVIEDIITMMELRFRGSLPKDSSAYSYNIAARFQSSFKVARHPHTHQQLPGILIPPPFLIIDERIAEMGRK